MKLKSYLPIALIAGLSLASCQEDTENFDNKVFSPTVNPVSNILVKEGTTAETGYVQAHMSKNEGFDVNVTFGVIADKVADYNSIYNQEAELLPQGFYEIPEPTATITAGMVQTPRVPVNFINLETLDVSKLYVLPVGIVSAPFDHMSNYVTYFVVREASIINVVANMTKTAATFNATEPEAPQLSGMEKITVEALLYPTAFPNMLATIMGQEGYFLVRVGDAGLDPNQIQIATSNGNITDPSWKLDVNVWTFLTFTYDTTTGAAEVYFNGVKKGATQYGNFRQPVNWNTGAGNFEGGDSGKPFFYVGFAWDNNRWFEGNMSELRVWNRVLSQEDITAPLHFYTVDPQSDGLVAYWKLDEGAGNIFHDSTNGYDLVCMPNADPDNIRPSWVEVALPEKSK